MAILVAPHRGFVPSVVGVIVHRSLYFGVDYSLGGRAYFLIPLTICPDTPRNACRPRHRFQVTTEGVGQSDNTVSQRDRRSQALNLVGVSGIAPAETVFGFVSYPRGPRRRTVGG